MKLFIKANVINTSFVSIWDYLMLIVSFYILSNLKKHTHTKQNDFLTFFPVGSSRSPASFGDEHNVPGVISTFGYLAL